MELQQAAVILHLLAKMAAYRKTGEEAELFLVASVAYPWLCVQTAIRKTKYPDLRCQEGLQQPRTSAKRRTLCDCMNMII